MPRVPSVSVSAAAAEGASAAAAAGRLHPDGGGRPQPAADRRRQGRVQPADGADGDPGSVEARPPPAGPAEEGAAQPAQGRDIIITINPLLDCFAPNHVVIALIIHCFIGFIDLRLYLLVYEALKVTCGLNNPLEAVSVPELRRSDRR